MKRRLFALLMFLSLFPLFVPSAAAASEGLVPVGRTVGMEIRMDGVYVVRFDPEAGGSPAEDAGMQVGDRIRSVNGAPVLRAEDLRLQVEASRGEALLFLVERGDKTLSFPVSPVSGSGGWRIGVYVRDRIRGLGTVTFYDPDTGAEYRDTDVAKQVLCDFYSVDTSKYADLDAAVASITGYDPVAAKELYTEAFKESLEKGYITDADNDGKCDQNIEITYSASTISDFISKTMDYLNEKMAEATKDTPFEGKISFNAIAFGNDWSDKIRSGQSDTVLGGWNGSLLDPYSVITCYTNPAQQYDKNWFDTNKETMTLTINGEEITMSLYNWGECLNGTEVDGHNFGSDAADQDTRLQVLAGLEGRILQTYDYIPMMQNAGMSLLSKKVFYVTEEYNAVLGRGGITYLKYNYNDAEWADYVKSEGGQLKY